MPAAKKSKHRSRSVTFKAPEAEDPPAPVAGAAPESPTTAVAGQQEETAVAGESRASESAAAPRAASPGLPLTRLPTAAEYESETSGPGSVAGDSVGESTDADDADPSAVAGRRQTRKAPPVTQHGEVPPNRRGTTRRGMQR